MFNWRFDKNENCISLSSSVREEGGRDRGTGFGGYVELGVIITAVEMDVVFTENVAEEKINDENTGLGVHLWLQDG